MTNRLIAKIAWILATESDDCNIGCLVTRLRKNFELSKDGDREFQDCIVDGLREMSKESGKYLEQDNGSEYGYSEELGAYWANTNAYTEWQSDMPDYWQELFED